MAIGKEERDAVMRVLDRGILSGYRGSWGLWFYGGDECQALEKEWADKMRVKHAIACNSATSGLWLACAALGLKPEEHVMVTPYSMTCSASMPLHFQAIPIFVDIEPDYFCMDPEALRREIQERQRMGLPVKAVIVVDLFGMPYDVDRLNKVAHEHGLAVIEDAAQAIGATYQGQYAGTLGDIGVYSLNVHKHIQCGEGGVVVTNSDDLARKIRMLMNHAEAVNNDLNQWDLVDLVGMNLRMTEIQAAIARAQLQKLDGIVAKYQDMAEIFPVKVRPDCTSSYYRYAWNSLGKLNFGDGLEDPRFHWKRHYIRPIFQMPKFQALGYGQDQCPVCRAVEQDIILAWPREVF